MNELRNRVLVPFAIPVLAAVVIVTVVFSISRVLLALQHHQSAGMATAVAIVLAAAVLFGSAYLASPRAAVSGKVVLSSAAVLLVGAGAVGLAAAPDRHGPETVKPESVTPNGPTSLTVTAFDIGFRPAELTATVGEQRIDYVNEGAIPHTLVFEDGDPTFKLEVTAAGDRDTGTVRLDPGAHPFYCDVPGHRSAGMEGVLTVE